MFEHDWETVVQRELDRRAANAEKETLEGKNRGGSWRRRGQKSSDESGSTGAKSSKNFKK